MVSCRLQLQPYLIIKNIQAIMFNLRTLIMIPEYVHLNPTALFYLWFIYRHFHYIWWINNRLESMCMEASHDLSSGSYMVESM